MSLIWQWRKKSHLIEIIQLLEVEKNINVKNPKTLETDAVIYFVLGTVEHAFNLYLTPGLPYTTPGLTCMSPPPALVTQLKESSACLLWLLLQDYVAKQEYPVVGH